MGSWETAVSQGLGVTWSAQKVMLSRCPGACWSGSALWPPWRGEGEQDPCSIWEPPRFPWDGHSLKGHRHLEAEPPDNSHHLILKSTQQAGSTSLFHVVSGSSSQPRLQNYSHILTGSFINKASDLC